MHNKPSAAAKPDELPNNSENQTRLLAHQLRNSLNGMMLRLELLGREVGEGGSKHLDRLRQDIVRLDQAIETMLRNDRIPE
jgi:signal transduction histidine kinase